MGTWIGSVKEIFIDSKGQLIIVITSDAQTVLHGNHDFEGTVILAGLSLCITQGLISSKIGARIC